MLTVRVPTPPSDVWMQRGGSHTGPQLRRQFMYGSGTATACNLLTSIVSQTLQVSRNCEPCGTCLFVSGGSTTVGCTHPTSSPPLRQSFVPIKTPSPSSFFSNRHNGSSVAHTVGRRTRTRSSDRLDRPLVRLQVSTPPSHNEEKIVDGTEETGDTRLSSSRLSRRVAGLRRGCG